MDGEGVKDDVNEGHLNMQGYGTSTRSRCTPTIIVDSRPDTSGSGQMNDSEVIDFVSRGHYQPGQVKSTTSSYDDSQSDTTRFVVKNNNQVNDDVSIFICSVFMVYHGNMILNFLDTMSGGLYHIIAFQQVQGTSIRSRCIPANSDPQHDTSRSVVMKGDGMGVNNEVSMQVCVKTSKRHRWIKRS